MKKINKKTRNGIIDRFFMSANELPHAISYLNKVDGWRIYKCDSANHSFEIAHKTTPFEQFIKWSQ